MITDTKVFAREITTALDDLFGKAKSVDEFEYIQTIVRLPGYAQLKKGYELFHVTESKRLIEDITHNFLDKELELYTKVRLGLLLYGHIIEMRDVYGTLENLLRICNGKTYDYSLYKGKVSINNRIAKIESLASKQKLNVINNLFKEIYSKGIRNSFFHSDYLLKDGKYYLLEGRKAEYKGIDFSNFDIETELVPILRNCINFALVYFQIRESQLRSYEKIQILNPTRPSTIKAMKIIPTPDGIFVTALAVPK